MATFLRLALLLLLVDVAAAAEPAPEVVREDLRGYGRAINDLLIQQVDLVGSDIRGLCWADPEGSAILVAMDSGTVRRIEFPTLRQTRRLDLGKSLSGLSLSSEGAVASAGATSEAWILDPDTLEVKKKVAMKGGDTIVAAPSIPTAISSDGKNLFIYDLKANNSRTFPVPKGAKFGYDYPTITSDGKFVFTTNGDQLFRLTIVGGILKPLDHSADIGAGAVRGIMVSPDGKYVCMPCRDGNRRDIKDHPEIKSNTTYVYSTASFRKPEFVIAATANPRSIGFDPVHKRAFLQDSDSTLSLFTYSGVRKSTYRFPGGDHRDVMQFLPHPEGIRLLIRTDDKLFVAELPPA